MQNKKPTPHSHKINKKHPKKVKTTAKRGFKTSAVARHVGVAIQYHRTHTKDGVAAAPADDAEFSVPLFPARPISDPEYAPVAATFNKREHGAQSIGARNTTVTIFKPCKNAMANEKNDAWGWMLREDRGFGSNVNQYTTGDDYVQSTEWYPVFHTLNEAVEWCQFEGIKYSVEEEPMRKYDLRSYADNFKWKGPADAAI